MTASLILVNGRFATLDRSNPDPEALAIADGKFLAVGSERDVRALADVKKRRSSTCVVGASSLA
jgi:predicted amidohydrolase YtcJ